MKRACPVVRLEADADATNTIQKTIKLFDEYIMIRVSEFNIYLSGGLWPPSTSTTATARRAIDRDAPTKARESSRDVR
jgi:uncharacterized protein (DUF2461 family)